MKNLVSILLCAILFSCISDADIQLAKSEKEICLNCLLNPVEDTIVAWLSYSRSVLTSANFEDIDNADVILFEADSLAGHFSKSDSTAWNLLYKVKPGKRYKIEVEVNGKTVSAETTVPLEVNGDISALQVYSYRFDYLVSFIDNIKEENYYWISAKGYNQYKGEPRLEKAMELSCNYLLADDFNRYTDNSTSGYQYYYEDYIRINDKSIPNDSVQVQFVAADIYLGDGPQEVFLFSVDYNLDKYMKSSLLMEENDLWAEDIPIVYSPFDVYTNVNGGVGIVGSYTGISKVFTKE